MADHVVGHCQQVADHPEDAEVNEEGNETAQENQHDSIVVDEVLEIRHGLEERHDAQEQNARQRRLVQQQLQRITVVDLLKVFDQNLIHSGEEHRDTGA